MFFPAMTMWLLQIPFQAGVTVARRGLKVIASATFVCIPNRRRLQGMRYLPPQRSATHSLLHGSRCVGRWTEDLSVVVEGMPRHPNEGPGYIRQRYGTVITV